MKKLLISVFLFLLICTPAFALIVTENVDKDRFDYEVAFQFATTDMGANRSATEVSVNSNLTSNLYYVVPREGNVVGMSVASSAAFTAGAATFDITINGTVTGIQTVLEPSTSRAAIGIGGIAGQYAYIRQDRAETNAARGFRASNDRASYHNAEHIYGRATPLVAGNRIGVAVTSSSNVAPITNDCAIVIYVLE